MPPSIPSIVSPGSLAPSDYRRLVAVGHRLLAPGQERVAYNGTLTLPGKSAVAVKVTVQMPNLLRVDVTGQGKPLTYDGITLDAGSLATNDAQALLEMFFEDSVESYMLERSKGMGSRQISAASNVVDSIDAPREVTHCEALEAFYPRQFGVAQTNPKTYCFDLTSQWPAYVFSTFTVGGKTTHRTIAFRNWTEIANGYYPYRVVVRDNGVLTYQYSATNGVVSAAAVDGVFPGH